MYATRPKRLLRQENFKSTSSAKKLGVNRQELHINDHYRTETEYPTISLLRFPNELPFFTGKSSSSIIARRNFPG